EWFRERFAARPVRPDRTAALQGEGGGRLDRLDLWVIAVLAVTLLSVRMWRLSEPDGVHLHQGYHAPAATGFPPDWRYGMSQYIYEWTHPHLAKYAMAVGIEALGQDKTGATSELGVPVTGAAIEPRWDTGQPTTSVIRRGTTPDVVSGDRLWIAT